MLSEFRYLMRHSVVIFGFWLLVGLLVTLLLEFVFLWRPINEQQQALLSRIEVFRKEILSAKHSTEISEAFEQVSKEMPKIEEKLLADNGQAKFVEVIEKILRKHSLRLTSQSFEEGKAIEGYSPLYLELAIQGRFQEVYGFIADIPSLAVWAEVQDVRMVKATKGNNAINAQVRVLTYRKGNASRGDGEG